jgi:hypothetical protein
VPKAAEARVARAATAVALLALSLVAQADVRTFYRWTDAQGRIQYSDKPPPASFKGQVTRMDVDTDSNTSAAEPPRAPRVAPDVLKDVTPDAANQRREKRARLEAAVKNAEKKLAEAKAAAAQGAELKDDDFNVVQRRFAKAQPGKANCRTITEGEKKSIICPALAPSEQYYDRQKTLDDAVRAAEEELAQAESAYRRGVD